MSRNRILTPKLAVELLENAAPNRPLNMATVRKYCADIRNGLWVGRTNIALLPDGRMFDGSRRCHAVVITGIPIPIRMIEAEIETQRTIDTGETRSVSQMLQIEGLQYPGTLAAGINAVAMLYGLAKTGKYPGSPKVAGEGRNYTSQEKFLILDAHPDLIESAKVVSHLDRSRTVALSKGWMVGVRSVAIYIGAEEAYDVFSRNVAVGDGLKTDQPEHLLRAKLFTASKSTTANLTTTARNGLWNLSWNSAYYGETRKRLTFTPATFPIPVGLDDWYAGTGYKA